MCFRRKSPSRSILASVASAVDHLQRSDRERLEQAFRSVESKRSAVANRTGGAECERRLFVVALAEKSITPFPLSAHRTGRDHFGHPALGRVSRGGMRRRTTIGRVERNHAEFPEHASSGKLSGTEAADVMPATEKFADRVVQIEFHDVPRL